MKILAHGKRNTPPVIVPTSPLAATYHPKSRFHAQEEQVMEEVKSESVSLVIVTYKLVKSGSRLGEHHFMISSVCNQPNDLNAYSRSHGMIKQETTHYQRCIVFLTSLVT